MNNETLFYAALAINKVYPFIQKDQGGRVWEPDLNDGDAFRLAVQLGFPLEIDPVHELDPGEWEINRYSAARMSIVRTAAEIGRNRSDWVINTCKADGCPINPNLMIVVIYDDDSIDFDKADSWLFAWNTEFPIHIKKYLIINQE